MMNKQPNLIYIFADQLRYSSVGYNGDRKACTPNIDRLASQSIDMCNAVSGHPVCAPYRASLFTGKYTTSTGMVINEIRLNPNHRSFAHVLNENGYETSYIGKWHMYAAELGNHLDPKNSYIPKGPDRLGFDGYFAAYNFHHDYYGATAYYHLDSPEKIYCDKYEPDTQTDMAMEQLNNLSKGDKPFALFLSLGTPHDPWIPQNVPGEYFERFKDVDFPLPPNYLPENDPHADAWAQLSEQERSELSNWMRCYYAMTANLDDNIGRIMDHIKTLGLDENTIVVFTSDHGELFGAHGRRAKNIFYEEAIRVPFLIRRQGALEQGVKRDVVFNTVDIMPTLLSMMELPIPETVEGSDYSRCVTGEADNNEGALMMCTGPTATFGDGNEWRAYRTKQYTYAIFKSDGQELLFDNLADPFQMNNLAGNPEYATIQAKLKAAMWNKMNKISDTFENNTYYQENWVENRLIMRTATSEYCDYVSNS
ncbi:MAG: sulfatase [Angelakisella sp.]